MRSRRRALVGVFRQRADMGGAGSPKNALICGRPSVLDRAGGVWSALGNPADCMESALEAVIHTHEASIFCKGSHSCARRGPMMQSVAPDGVAPDGGNAAAAGWRGRQSGAARQLRELPAAASRSERVGWTGASPPIACRWETGTVVHARCGRRGLGRSSARAEPT